MLKKSASFVLAALRGSTYDAEYASPLRLLRPRWTAFDHPAGTLSVITDSHISQFSEVSKWFFNGLLGSADLPQLTLVTFALVHQIHYTFPRRYMHAKDESSDQCGAGRTAL